MMDVNQMSTPVAMSDSAPGFMSVKHVPCQGPGRKTESSQFFMCVTERVNVIGA